MSGYSSAGEKVKYAKGHLLASLSILHDAGEIDGERYAAILSLLNHDEDLQPTGSTASSTAVNSPAKQRCTPGSSIAGSVESSKLDKDNETASAQLENREHSPLIWPGYEIATSTSTRERTLSDIPALTPTRLYEQSPEHEQRSSSSSAKAKTLQSANSLPLSTKGTPESTRRSSHALSLALHAHISPSEGISGSVLSSAPSIIRRSHAQTNLRYSMTVAQEDPSTPVHQQDAHAPSPAPAKHIDSTPRVREQYSDFPKLIAISDTSEGRYDQQADYRAIQYEHAATAQNDVFYDPPPTATSMTSSIATSIMSWNQAEIQARQAAKAEDQASRSNTSIHNQHQHHQHGSLPPRQQERQQEEAEGPAAASTWTSGPVRESRPHNKLHRSPAGHQRRTPSPESRSAMLWPRWPYLPRPRAAERAKVVCPFWVARLPCRFSVCPLQHCYPPGAIVQRLICPDWLGVPGRRAGAGCRFAWDECEWAHFDCLHGQWAKVDVVERLKERAKEKRDVDRL
ncbi:hypothetical protein JX266_001368 [Neoarthrinium moseri]|nr:hypothetical protein JX266_001368 [Neoarthrinium moseri]